MKKEFFAIFPKVSANLLNRSVFVGDMWMPMSDIAGVPKSNRLKAPQIDYEAIDQFPF